MNTTLFRGQEVPAESVYGNGAQASAGCVRPASGPGSRYVAVPGEVIEKKLQDAGFERFVIGNEVAYRRAMTPCKNYKYCKHSYVMVLTTIPASQGPSAIVRGCGEDAIRIGARYMKPGVRGEKDWDFSIASKKRIVKRMGSVEAVLDRMMERAREAYQDCIDRCVSEKRCRECCGW